MVARLNKLEARSKRTALSVYRHVRRSLRSEDLLDNWRVTADGLTRRVADDGGYAAVMLGVKLAHIYTVVSLRHAGAPFRAQRKLLSEACYLLRQEIRVSLGLRPRDPSQTLNFSAHTPLDWVVRCDGSVRGRQASVGFVLQGCGGFQGRCATVSLPMGCLTALEAEIAAAELALRTAAALGASSVRLETDSLGVLRAFEGRLALKFCVQEDSLHRLVGELQHLEVLLVPRLATRVADKLAAAAHEG